MIDMQKIISATLSKELSDGRVTIARSSDDALGVRATLITIIPRQKHAAGATVYLLPDSISMSLGANTVLEVRIGQRDDEQVAFVEQVLRALAEGRFSEILWRRRGIIIRSTATLVLTKETLRLRKWNSLDAWLPGTRTEVVYQPY